MTTWTFASLGLWMLTCSIAVVWFWWRARTRSQRQRLKSQIAHLQQEIRTMLPCPKLTSPSLLTELQACDKALSLLEVGRLDRQVRHYRSWVDGLVARCQKRVNQEMHLLEPETLDRLSREAVSAWADILEWWEVPASEDALSSLLSCLSREKDVYEKELEAAWRLSRIGLAQVSGYPSALKHWARGQALSLLLAAYYDESKRGSHLCGDVLLKVSFESQLDEQALKDFCMLSGAQKLFLA